MKVHTVDNLFKNLNKEQLSAVKHQNGPLLIVAGAGTGKTTVITRKIAYLIEQKIARPNEILALTFTEKAAGEMQERVDLLLPLGYYDMWISTFHSFCERILKLHGLDIGLPNDFKLLNETQGWILVYRNFEKFKLNYYRPLGNPSKFISALLKHFSKCKDEVISPQEYLAYAQDLRLNLDQPNKTKRKELSTKFNTLNSQLSTPTPSPSMDETEIARLEEIANAFHVYQKLLVDNNYLDFGDLINYTIKLFETRPKLLNYYKEQFKHILVDEFQDTNFAQYKLVKMLAGDRQNICVVGDDDQSIYKFRGASVSNILKFKEDYRNFSQITLNDNYRSTQEILDLAYNFIQKNNPERLEFKLNINKRLKSCLNPHKETEIKVIESLDISGELNEVAKKIIQIKNTPPLIPPLDMGGIMGVSWNDFAILIRSNSASDALLPVLQNHSIPFTYVSNRGLYKKPIVYDLISYFEFLENTDDSNALYKILTLPKFYLRHQELSFLLAFSHKKTVSLFEALKSAATFPEITETGKKNINNLLHIAEKHFAYKKNHSAAELTVLAIKDIGLEEKLKEDTLQNAESRELLENFYKKIEKFQEQEQDHSLHNFLNLLKLELEAGNEGEIPFDPNLGPESVKVLTVHSAKGLEFENVFIINLVDQRFPTREKGEPINIPEALIKDILPQGDFHLQEERRLFYVAITRAKRRLFFTWAKDYGGSRQKKPSEFLVETGLVSSEKTSKATGKVIFSHNLSLPVVYQNLPSKFSYSQLIDFETCPLKYKYQHYLKLPVPGTQHLSFGQTIHKVFEEYLKLYKNSLQVLQMDLFSQNKFPVLPNKEILEKLYEKNWVDDWYENKTEKERYKKEGQKMLDVFYKETLQNTPKPKYIEQFFKLKLGEYEFVGKIDRADETKNGLLIIDYKTGKVPKNKKDIDQLYIYQWAIQEFLKEQVSNLKYWYLSANEFVEEPLADSAKIIELKAQLLKTIDKILYTTKHNLFKREHDRLPHHDCPYSSLEI